MVWSLPTPASPVPLRTGTTGTWDRAVEWLQFSSDSYHLREAQTEKASTQLKVMSEETLTLFLAWTLLLLTLLLHL